MEFLFFKVMNINKLEDLTYQKKKNLINTNSLIATHNLKVKVDNFSGTV